VLKPAESTPISILVLIELIADLLPAGVVNIVNGYGREAGMPLASSRRIAKIAFTGSTATGKVIAQAAANNLIPATLELVASRPTSSLPMWPMPMTNSSTKPSKAWCCSPSTRARSAPALARSSKSRFTTSSWTAPWRAYAPSSKAAHWTPTA
jgi:aldehyde dehydrogenase